MNWLDRLFRKESPPDHDLIDTLAAKAVVREKIRRRIEAIAELDEVVKKSLQGLDDKNNGGASHVS